MGKTGQNYFFILVVLLIFGGWGVNFLAARDDSYQGEIKLLEFPAQVGEWQGNDESIGIDALNILQADAVLFRKYQNAARETMWFYVSYHRSQKEGRLIHSPKHCYPGSGWDIVSKEVIDLTLPDGQTLSVNKMLVSKDQYKQLVLYWYQSPQRVVASEYLQRLALIKDVIVSGRSDGSLVRISMEVGTDEAATLEREKRFLELFYPKLIEYLPSKFS